MTHQGPSLSKLKAKRISSERTVSEDRKAAVSSLTLLFSMLPVFPPLRVTQGDVSGKLPYRAAENVVMYVDQQ